MKPEQSDLSPGAVPAFSQRAVSSHRSAPCYGPAQQKASELAACGVRLAISLLHKAVIQA